MENTNYTAGSATGIDLNHLQRLADTGQPIALKPETFAALVALARATPQHPRPTDDHLWDETLRDRDNYEEWADKLAGAIAIHFGVEIGEHSNMNCPWTEALDAIESAPSADAATPQHSVTEQDERDWPAGYAAWLRATGAYPFDNDKRNQVDAFKAGAEWARAQPLASTAAQPEQARIKPWQERVNLDEYEMKRRDAVALFEANREIADLRAALAIPAPTAGEQPTICAPNCFYGDCPPCGAAGLRPAAASEQQAGADEALMHIQALVEFAYKQGFHELGYDPVEAVRAALANRATTAASEPELIRAGWFLYEGIAWTPTSSDDPRATILYRKAERAAAPDMTTTAADKQGDTASASIGSDSNFRDLAVAWASKKYAVITSGHEAAWSDLVAHVDGRAQQGAAQAQAGGLKSCECSPAQRRKCDVCAGYGSAAMAAPTTTGGSNV